MEIRNTKLEDLDRVMEIYRMARSFMAEHGNPNQWGKENWPPRELIVKDIQERRSYVCVESKKVIGVFYFEYGTDIDPTYRIIKGQWIGEDTYGVVHRIASDHSIKGIGSFCINWAYEQCHHLRMDTHGDNYVMQNCLKKLGFQECGIIYVREDPDPRIAYEKL